MANVYTNYKAILSTSALTTLYTVGSETTAIIKSIRVSNTDEENNCKISLYLIDSDSVSYNLQTNRKVQKGRSEELLAAGNLDQESGDSSTVPAVPLVHLVLWLQKNLRLSRYKRKMVAIYMLF